jgi:hypothetical protein
MITATKVQHYFEKNKAFCTKVKTINTTVNIKMTKTT